MKKYLSILTIFLFPIFLQADFHQGPAPSSGSSGANTTLSNLGTTAINASLLFNAASTYDIGDATNYPEDLFIEFIKRPNGTVLWDMNNDRINDSSANPSIYADDKLLRTGTHGAPVTKLDWSGATDVILGNDAGLIKFKDSSRSGASNGYVWTLANQTTGAGGWAAASGGGSLDPFTGDIVPTADSSQDIGDATHNIGNTYTNALWSGSSILANLSAGAFYDPVGQGTALSLATRELFDSEGFQSIDFENRTLNDIDDGSDILSWNSEGITILKDGGTGLRSPNNGSGQTHDIGVFTGNANTDSGSIYLQTGTAGGNRGIVYLNAMSVWLPQQTADPTPAAFEGNLYYNTTDHTLKYYNGTAWKTVTAL